MSELSLPPASGLSVADKASLLLQLHALQGAGYVGARGDGASLDALLVQLGLSQSEVGWLMGRSQQAVSLSVARYQVAAASKRSKK
jgi:hypothetical protein